MSITIEEIKKIEQQLQEIARNMTEEKDAGTFVKLKQEAEDLISKLPKEPKLRWELSLKKIRKPRTPTKAERDKMRLSQIKKNTLSPTQALASGILISSDSEQVHPDSNSTSSEEKIETSIATEILKDELPIKDENKEIIATSESEKSHHVESKNNEGDSKDNKGDVSMTQIITPVIEQDRPTPVISPFDLEEGKKKRLAKLRSKAKKVKVEDTHTRKTYLVRNDLLERIEKVSNGTHGFKIEFINFAIELALAEYEIIDEEESE